MIQNLQGENCEIKNSQLKTHNFDSNLKNYQNELKSKNYDR